MLNAHLLATTPSLTLTYFGSALNSPPAAPPTSPSSAGTNLRGGVGSRFRGRMPGSDQAVLSCLREGERPSVPGRRVTNRGRGAYHARPHDENEVSEDEQARLSSSSQVPPQPLAVEHPPQHRYDCRRQRRQHERRRFVPGSEEPSAKGEGVVAGVRGVDSSRRREGSDRNVEKGVRGDRQELRSDLAGRESGRARRGVEGSERERGERERLVSVELVTGVVRRRNRRCGRG